MTCGGGVRTLLSGDPIILSTETERLNLENFILNKMYIVLESSITYIYSNGWYQLGIPIDTILDKCYPIGSIYMSINSTSPASLFGGTWESIKDTFLLAAGDIYTNGITGGESEHILNEEEMPVHHHEVYPYNVGGSSTSNAGYIVTPDGYRSLTSNFTDGSVYLGLYIGLTNDKGSSKSHNNMPPYFAVYMWKRIS